MFISKLSKWSVLACVVAALLPTAVPFTASAQTGGAATPASTQPSHRHHRHHHKHWWRHHHRHHRHFHPGQSGATTPTAPSVK
jgi:Ni/Co efflux regulator RcnB